MLFYSPFNFFAGYPPGTETWLGANDLALPGRLVWTDGRQVGEYTNFDDDQGKATFTVDVKNKISRTIISQITQCSTVCACRCFFQTDPGFGIPVLKRRKKP